MKLDCDRCGTAFDTDREGAGPTLIRPAARRVARRMTNSPAFPDRRSGVVIKLQAVVFYHSAAGHHGERTHANERLHRRQHRHRTRDPPSEAVLQAVERLTRRRRRVELVPLAAAVARQRAET
jgi:hypothetical protein